MMNIILGIFVVALTVSSSWAETFSNETLQANDTCGQEFTKENGTIKFHSSSSRFPSSKSCTWKISANGTGKTIFLVWDNIVLKPEDDITIKDNSTDLNFKNPFKTMFVPGAFSFLTGETEISVTVVTGNGVDRVFQMHYYINSACNHTFSTALSGSFQTPMYPTTYPMPVQCYFKVAVPAQDDNILSLWLDKYNFTDGTVKVDHGDKSASFNGSNFPDYEFLSDKEINIAMNINNNKSVQPEIFKVNYNSVTKKCSEQMNSTPGGKTLTFLTRDDIQAMMMDFTGIDHRKVTCQWLVECDMGKMISVQLKNVSLPNALDQLLILDGPNRSSAALLDMTVANKDKFTDKIIYSSGNQLWISGSTISIDTDFTLDIAVNTASSGGYKRGNGDISVDGTDDTTTYLLEVDSGKQVKLIIDLKSLKLQKDSKISFYSDFKKDMIPFTSVISGQNFTEYIVSPTEKMAIITSSFKSSILKASFMETEQDCSKFASGNEDTFSVVGNCNNTCAWGIQPKTDTPQGSFAFHFSITSLSGGDLVLIRKMNAAQTLIANLSAPTFFIPDLWLLGSDGVFFEVKRENCVANSTVLKASYTYMQECQAMLEPKLGEIVHVSSPNYPNYYPLGADCKWTVKRPAGSAFLHVTMNDLKLASPNHTLTFFITESGKRKELAVFNNTSSLGDDYPVMSDLEVEFSTKLVEPFRSDSGSGFSISIAAVEYGSVSTNDSGVIQNPEFPKPVVNGSLYAWIVKVPSNDTAQALVHFNFANSTNHTNLDKYLKLYDGASLRSVIITNFNNSSMNLSRTNSLIFLYRRADITIQGPSFNINYDSFACNMSLLCANKICMQEDWHCNGINDCGDYSDERNCQGGLPPPPTPAPAPTPGPRPKPNGVTTAALAVGILLALVIGAALGVGAPAAYRRIRGNQFQSYSSFTNNIE